MAKVDIFSGFLGAGKTTLIKKLIEEAYKGEQVVLIENEFGEIGIDGGFLKDAGVKINEMNSGCICCSLVGDFGRALDQVIADYDPDRILIEPSGVGKLSDVILAVEGLHNEKIALNGFTTVVDAKKCKMYMKNFGEFFNNQIENASTIVLSHTSGLSQEKLDQCVELIKGHNDKASLITTPWDELTGAQILETMERKNTIQIEMTTMTSAAAVTTTSIITIMTIITTTMPMSAAAATTITITSIIMNMTLIPTTTITTMPTKCSPASVWRRRRSSLRRA